LTHFTTDDPAYACLALGPPLAVYADPTVSGDDIAVAPLTTTCSGRDFSFPT
jgi:hypothetical protein